MSMILTPTKVKNIGFKNKIVMAPMANFRLPSRNGVMGDELLQYYLNYTDKEIGLIILQAMFVMPSFENLPWAFKPEHMVPLKKIVDAAHEHGSRIFLQLVMNGQEFEEKGGINGLAVEEIEQVRDSFIASAKLCKETGFDGIELHGAHELFLNQVSSELTNHRTDRYGGDKDGRLALAKEIISGIKAFADEKFIASYRMGATFDLEKDVETAKALVGAGLDMLHVSYGITDVRQIHIPQEFAEYDEIVYAGCHIKHHVNVPTIVVSNINTLQRGEKLLGQGDCDFVAYGRPFLRDPAFLINQIEQERTL